MDDERENYTDTEKPPPKGPSQAVIDCVYL